MSTLDMRGSETQGREVRYYDRMRGHRFQPPKADLAKVPGLYETEHVPTADKVFHVHYFTGAWDWYVAELDQETGEAFGLVKGHDTEWGYFNLYELATTRVPVAIGPEDRRLHLPVERDKWFRPTRASEVRT